MEVAGKWYIQFPSRTDAFSIWPMADVHFGNRGCAVKVWQRDIDAIAADPRALWFGLGDLGEYISIDDPRFDAAVIDENTTPEQLGDLGYLLGTRIRDRLKPIAAKCLGLGLGNHELRYYREKEQTHMHHWLLQEMAHAAGHMIPNLGYSAFFDLVFIRNPSVKRPILTRTTPLFKGRSDTLSRYSLRFIVHHGAGTAQSRGGKANALARMAALFDADIYVQAHNHTPEAQTASTVGADPHCRKLTERRRLLVRTGPYLLTYAHGVTGYAEQRMYETTSLGAKPIHVLPDKRKVWATVAP